MADEKIPIQLSVDESTGFYFVTLGIAAVWATKIV
jgi:hypothetical protein